MSNNGPQRCRAISLLTGRDYDADPKAFRSASVTVRSADWLKVKNMAAPAVKREAEEDWGDKRGRKR